ncbi:hypothetical protein DKX38_011368 [Salix brachista]|uniref:Uncharacterized protein n=1 Tax=Salix brachista TaxID=2182728 RepID=A0A5N5LYW0_9ROSI|nr:hypothetical protein DKX38_011365 [Salix brachista]KAB5547962.1 hypothetical protein DKX38_011368 [Salix brachista]
MKQLIRRLSRFADSSQYSLLRSNSQSTPSTATAHRGSGGSRSAHRRVAGKTVLEGHVPVYVGDEMERFTRGGLRIPCHVLVFERVIDSLRLGHESGNLEDLLGSLFIFEDYL